MYMDAILATIVNSTVHEAKYTIPMDQKMRLKLELLIFWVWGKDSWAVLSDEQMRNG